MRIVFRDWKLGRFFDDFGIRGELWVIVVSREIFLGGIWKVRGSDFGDWMVRECFYKVFGM